MALKINADEFSRETFWKIICIQKMIDILDY